MRQYLAVDLGGTKTATAVVDEHGGIMVRNKVPAARSVVETVEQIVSAAKDVNVLAAGIIVPGIYTASDGRAWAPNLWGWDPVPLREALVHRLDLPVAIGNDRTGYVVGEQWLGAARGLDDVVFLAVGTGIGAGILSGGRVIEGAHGVAGAVGWMTLDAHWKDEYERTGCWEWEAAGPALARRAGGISPEEVVRLARLGNESALAALRETADWLGRGIANLINLLNPEMVVLGGGLMHAGDLLLPLIRASAGRWAQPLAMQRTVIELTKLGEDAGLLGAARLAMLSRGE